MSVTTPPNSTLLVLGVFARLRIAAGDIKLAHSIFALPFAILAAFMARPALTPWTRFGAQLALIVVCMVLARTWAMLINRLADRAMDAKNPRTARRALASGRLSARAGWAIALGCAGLFIAACAVFMFAFSNPWPVILSLPVLLWIAFYSYTKRFTLLCHLFLGGALAASPLASAIAIDPDALGSVPAIWYLAAMVVLWVAGFDVIYALQDVAFDRRAALHSVPSRLGAPRAIWISRALHAGALAMLVLAAGRDARFGPIFFLGVGLVGVLLVIEHVILARQGEKGLDMAFFTVNGIVSCVLGLSGVVDMLL